MTFQLVYYSQQDPKWKQDILGFGDPGDTIGYVGCALASVSMLLSGHGFSETPKTLNQKLKNVSGFVSAGIRWGAVSQIYPQVNMKSFISCASTDAPLGQIDASIAAGQPVIVMVDSAPAPGLSTHWVVLYAKEGSDYLMLDPWPYQTDVTKKTYLMPRYSQGNPLKRSIMHVIIYEAFNASGGIAQPDSSSTTSTPQTPPLVVPVSTGSFPARVKADVAWGLNIRSSIDTSSTGNIIISVPAGTLLNVLSADDYAKIGGVNQWVRVRDSQGHEGFAAAWYLEKAQTATPVVETAPVSTSTQEAPAPKPKPAPSSLIVVVQSRVGKFGAKVYETASTQAHIVSTEKVRAKLVVIEDQSKARPKIGKAGKWLNVQTKAGKKGFVNAELVALAE
ncbi:MAG: SH3 domain-containing protein [Anaerolineales bacterium]|nr:SH3 domain-containing protein [Anaerolineales bacterium]